jgi:hypothetical protein
MDISNKPMETIQQWQEWYRANRKVACLDEPLLPKESYKKPHDTTNAVDTMPERNLYYKELIEDMNFNSNDNFKQKAKEQFADTISEFIHEMTGDELFYCFLAAVLMIADIQKTELDNTQQLIKRVMDQK